jgi:hypothetical protein
VDILNSKVTAEIKDGPRALDEEGSGGKQSHLGTRSTPEALLDKVNKGTAKWQTTFTANIKPECTPMTTRATQP